MVTKTSTKQDKHNLMHQAVSLLARRDHSRYEIKQKLLKKGHAEDAIERVVSELQNRGYLDDQRYTQMMIRYHYSRGQGPQKIRYLLNNNGVSSTLVDQTFTEFDQDWFALACDVRKKRFGTQFKSADKQEQFKEKSKQIRFLMSRGFESDQIQNAIDELRA